MFNTWPAVATAHFFPLFDCYLSPFEVIFSCSRRSKSSGCSADHNLLPSGPILVAGICHQFHRQMSASTCKCEGRWLATSYGWKLFFVKKLNLNFKELWDEKRSDDFSFAVGSFRPRWHEGSAGTSQKKNPIN